jgi:hypothetical protein
VFDYGARLERERSETVGLPSRNGAIRTNVQEQHTESHNGPFSVVRPTLLATSPVCPHPPLPARESPGEPYRVARGRPASQVLSWALSDGREGEARAEQ